MVKTHKKGIQKAQKSLEDLLKQTVLLWKKAKKKLLRKNGNSIN